jgi:hypothetical protein
MQVTGILYSQPAFYGFGTELNGSKPDKSQAIQDRKVISDLLEVKAQVSLVVKARLVL